MVEVAIGPLESSEKVGILSFGKPVASVFTGWVIL